MAYSLGDPYRSLRMVLRVNGILLGLLLGAALLVAAPRLLGALGFVVNGPLLPWRLAGTGLIAAGAFLLSAAFRPEIDRGVLTSCTLFHALLALALLLGYLQGDFAVHSPFSLLVLLSVFLLCLLGALAPLRYFGAEYRL